jgi:enediyne biosynthesis protein E4
MQRFLSWCFSFLGLTLIACNNQTNRPLFQLLTNTGVDFQNNVEDGKIENSFLFRNFYNGGGVAIGDINNDGLTDLFFTSNLGANKLYLNKGNLQFEDISVKAGILPDDKWYTGVVFVDIDNDGWLDMYVCSSGHMTNGNRKNKLYINNHNLGFTESATQYGLDISAYTTQVSFFDYDMDGDLDCFMINNSPIPINQLNFSGSRDLPEKQWKVGEFLKGGGDHLYRNDNGRFAEVTYESGIHGSLISFGLGVSVGDINGDGYPDVYVSNDSYERDYLYINQKNGKFKDEFETWMEHTSMSSMGADLADINNDGYPDIFTTDMLPDDDYRLKTTGGFDNIDLYNSKIKNGFYRQFVKNCLQLNNKNGTFLEIANYSGVSASDWSWGALFFDADNDGFNDIYVCNGVNRDVIDLDFMDFFANDVIQKMVLTGKKENIDEVLKKIPRNPLPNKMFKNKGNLKFDDIGNAWGLTQATFSNGAAYGDLDNDGDLDLVVNNENQKASIYQNNSNTLTGNNYIGISLKSGSKNTFAVGTKIKVYAGGQIMYREFFPSRGFQSSVDYKQIIGLGNMTTIDSIVLDWPDRKFTKINSPAINQVLKITEPINAQSIESPINDTKSIPFLQIEDSSFEKHQEDDFIDFYYERNLPEMLSREGPKAATGDVNGDGLTDVYIGGTVGHPGQVYFQTAEGRFVKSKQPSIDQYADFEDGAVLFFDVNNDGAPDLFVGPGGNNNPPESRQMQTRLFMNDGRGNFKINIPSIPINKGVNTNVATAYDFNGDGFLDLFVGGRSIPNSYGSTPSSFLYVNDGKGHFTDMAKQKNPDIANIGMVTGAVWADVAGDTQKELIIVGQWMAPRVFSFTKDHFEEVKTNLSDLYGWWQTVHAADLDGDGKEDIILGNIGENFYLRPNAQKPVKLWVSDFDQNSTPDIILSETINGKDMPVFLKHDLQDQIPSIKKQSLRHAQFAKKSIPDFFSAEIINKSTVKIFNYSSSCIAFSKGNGNFAIEALPPMVQISSVNAISFNDVNGDGLSDLVLGGNNFCFPPQFGRLDASVGSILINKGKGKFEWIYPGESGINVDGMVRNICFIPGKSSDHLLFLINDQLPALYNIHKQESGKNNPR